MEDESSVLYPLCRFSNCAEDHARETAATLTKSTHLERLDADGAKSTQYHMRLFVDDSKEPEPG